MTGRRREDVLADILALHDWLADNPDVPTPDLIEACCYQSDVEQETSVAIALGVAARHDGRKEASNGFGWVIVRPEEAPSCKYVVYTADAPEKSGSRGPAGWQ